MPGTGLGTQQQQPGTGLQGLGTQGAQQGGLPGAQPGTFPGGLGKPGEVTGLPIIGVKTLCTDKPFRIYKDSEDYARWQFTILDLERQQVGNPGAPPVGVNAPQQPGEKGGEKKE
jgi:hypothetical protein